MKFRLSDIELQHRYETSVIKDTGAAYITLYVAVFIASLVFGIDVQYSHQILSNLFVFYMCVILFVLEYRRGVQYGVPFNQFLVLEYLIQESKYQSTPCATELHPQAILDWVELPLRERNKIKNYLRAATGLVVFVMWFVVSAIPGMLIEVLF